MTDRDDSSEGFLGRWSRKKIEGESERPDAPRTTDGSTPDELASPERRAGDAKIPVNQTPENKTPVKAAPHPEFDLASLPSLESITAATDVRAFLSPGVPTELARAALRRAWSADPAIRDFVGLAENAWDFTDPTAMAGFGELPPGYDVKKLVAQIFGDGDKPTDPGPFANEPTDPQVAPVAKEIAASVSPAEAASDTSQDDESGSPDISAGERQVVQDDLVQRDNNIASHNSNSDDVAEEHKNRRQHGGALPQ